MMLGRRSRWKRLVLASCLAMMPGQAPIAIPIPASPLPVLRSAGMHPPALPAGGIYASLGNDLQIQGQALSAWVFDAPGSVPDLAVWLSRTQPALRDMLVLPGNVILSGTSGAVQWAARLSDAGAGRTRGTLSALTLDAAHAARTPAVAWRLDGGHLHFELRSRDGEHAVVEQVWTHDAPPPELLRALRRTLAASGWREQAAAGEADAVPVHRIWSKRGVQLSVALVAAMPGSGVATVLRLAE